MNASAMSSSSQSPTDIERLFMSLNPEGQYQVLQKLKETLKSTHVPLSPPQLQAPSTPKQTMKRELQSPETPYKGRSRKV